MFRQTNIGWIFTFLADRHKTISDPEAVILSPGYPRGYPIIKYATRSICNYHIQFGRKQTVTLSFDEFYIPRTFDYEGNEDCRYIFHILALK